MKLFDNSIVSLHQSDARTLHLPDESVDCVVTSPPYWGLRDYGIGEWLGGDEGCDHTGPPHRTQSGFNERWYGKQFKEDKQGGLNEPYKDICGKCGAKRIDDGIGLEATPEQYCIHMVAVFREVWRVLKPTGTVWMNLGDVYAQSGASGGSSLVGPRKQRQTDRTAQLKIGGTMGFGLKPKNLMGMPWRVAFALQADGWYLRSDIIWSKPNPMPESVTDRPTKAHEYVFLLTKSPRYYYDADAIRETHNKRTVWEIPTQPYPEAHFATYPEKLVEPCILAGTSEKGVCAECGKPWERITDKKRTFESGSGRSGVLPHGKNGYNLQGGGETVDIRRGPVVKHTTIGWQPTCDCDSDTVPTTVFDPFAGSGTTLVVAQKLGRKGVGVDLNAEYLKLAQKRLESLSLPFDFASGQ